MLSTATTGDTGVYQVCFDRGGDRATVSPFRRHCANKVQSLYKVLNFQHGRTKYQKRKIEPATVQDPRWERLREIAVMSSDLSI